MPWDSQNYPDAFNNLSPDQRKQAIAIAESKRKQCMERGGNEADCARQAIIQALGVVKGSEDMQKVLAEPTRLSEIKQLFDDNVRGIDIAIDVAHDDKSRAAGWIRGLSIGPSTTKEDKQALFSEVDWTPYGKELIEGGEYRYISAEFGPYEDAETRKKFDNVLYAVTLTNRPFIKGMQAIDPESGRIEILREGDYFHPQYGDVTIKASEPDQNMLHKLFAMLSTYFSGEESARPTPNLHNPKEVNNVDNEKLRNLLSEQGAELEEDSDVYEVLTTVLAEKDSEISDLTEQVETLEASEPEPEDNTQAEEPDDESNTELSEANKKLEERISAVEAENTKLSAQLENEKMNKFFDELIRDGKLLPAEREKFAELYKDNADTVKALLSEREPVVDFEEHGSASDETADEVDEFNKKVNKLAEEKSIPRHEAFDMLVDEVPTEGGEQ